MDQRDKVCSYKNYKKSIFANLLLFFVNGEFYTEVCRHKLFNQPLHIT